MQAKPECGLRQEDASGFFIFILSQQVPAGIGCKEIAMEYQALAKDILSHVGGKENIVSLVHCATRLRFKTER
ncbi:PTS system beta-glucoside-specific transporter subunit IIBCA [Enterobacter cancerogenus]|uniref:PTS system beta-glucoside-specific transporter subunit IIBCA n=1 Tax=Enterobacter cancerogenus TaxID=69218 RepID=A0A484YGI1_9ENTR|nr:PTS system beta-glucoside-specific transporter subunit IIBCA [Enterobacter cancerogenus]